MIWIKLSQKERRKARDIIGCRVVKEDDNLWVVEWLLGDDSIVVKSDKFTSCVKANEYIDDIEKAVEDYLSDKIIRGLDDDD